MVSVNVKVVIGELIVMIVVVLMWFICLLIRVVERFLINSDIEKMVKI